MVEIFQNKIFFLGVIFVVPGGNAHTGDALGIENIRIHEYSFIDCETRYPMSR
ncbi:hypothetical protein [Oscillibacter sp. 1-3]|uniref:hypothetical protein n=1 Tax=Oscillibacter sp. 1-3 TaxID=1235797 RepID=UPI00039BAB45|nr:hypothetical protein [Oscillibacter sp. 1-3]